MTVGTQTISWVSLALQRKKNAAGGGTIQGLHDKRAVWQLNIKGHLVLVWQSEGILWYRPSPCKLMKGTEMPGGEKVAELTKRLNDKK